MCKNFYTKRHTGFTLVEVMVSVSIFAIIMTVGIGSLLVINASYRKSQAERTVVDNLDFTIESMAREIRVGTKYMPGSSASCGPNNSGYTSIRFVDPDGQDIGYSFVSDGGRGKIVKQGASGNVGDLTDTALVDIDLNQSCFIVLNEDPADNRQPYVIITVTGTTGVGNQMSTYTMQTSVTQRQLDMPVAAPTGGAAGGN